MFLNERNECGWWDDVYFAYVLDRHAVRLNKGLLLSILLFRRVLLAIGEEKTNMVSCESGYQLLKFRYRVAVLVLALSVLAHESLKIPNLLLITLSSYVYMHITSKSFYVFHADADIIFHFAFHIYIFRYYQPASYLLN